MTKFISEERSLSERVKGRIAIEEHFARIGHTNRHGRWNHAFENYFVRPVLKTGLRAAGLYNRGLQNGLRPVVREIRLDFQDLPPSFEGFQVLHLSDFHIDGVDGLAEVLAPFLRQLRPDVCVFTGDYRFEDRGPCEGVYPRMRKVVESISAKHGIYAILGNHDAAEIAFALEDLGVRMLVNESAEIGAINEQIWIAGLDDNFDYQCHDLPAALANIPEGAFTILLAHAPESFEEAANSGVNLYLTGHTHAGQIRLPFLGAIKKNARCPRPYMYGLWKYARMYGYTSAGIGCSSVPVRFNCPPEAVLFELRRSTE